MKRDDLECAALKDAEFDRAYLAGYEAAHTAWSNRVAYRQYCIAGREESSVELAVMSDTSMRHLRNDLDAIRQNRSGVK
jgi:hypothetical protein